MIEKYVKEGYVKTYYYFLIEWEFSSNIQSSYGGDLHGCAWNHFGLNEDFMSTFHFYEIISTEHTIFPTTLLSSNNSLTGKVEILNTFLNLFTQKENNALELNVKVDDIKHKLSSPEISYTIIKGVAVGDTLLTLEIPSSPTSFLFGVEPYSSQFSLLSVPSVSGCIFGVPTESLGMRTFSSLPPLSLLLNCNNADIKLPFLLGGSLLGGEFGVAVGDSLLKYLSPSHFVFHRGRTFSPKLDGFFNIIINKDVASPVEIDIKYFLNIDGGSSSYFNIKERNEKQVDIEVKVGEGNIIIKSKFEEPFNVELRGVVK